MTCTKRSYETEEAAREATWRLVHAVYQCPRCQLWHSTKAAQGPDDLAREAEAVALLHRQHAVRDAFQDARQRARRLRRQGRRKRP